MNIPIHYFCYTHIQASSCRKSTTQTYVCMYKAYYTPACVHTEHTEARTQTLVHKYTYEPVTYCNIGTYPIMSRDSGPCDLFPKGAPQHKKLSCNLAVQNTHNYAHVRPRLAADSPGWTPTGSGIHSLKFPSSSSWSPRTMAAEGPEDSSCHKSVTGDK